MIRALRNTYLKRIKNRKVLKCDRNVVISNSDIFEGKNLLSENVIFVNSHLGYASYIGRGSELYNTYIGRYSCIGPKVNIVMGQHPTKQFVSIHPIFFSVQKQIGFTYVKKQKFQEYKTIDGQYSVKIGNDVWIGQGCIIMEGIIIGDGAIIAAGSVIVKDVPPFSIVGGVPAKVIRYRFTEPQIKYLKKLEWWSKDEEWIKRNADKFENVDMFCQDILFEEK